MCSSAYQVTLPVFAGPLDLLLHLIEREELDITQVSLAQVTNQYLDYLAQVSERDPDSLADFLVVAAKLLLIKSRVLLPQPPTPPPAEEEEIGQDLVRQLVEYKKFKEAAHWLKEVEEQGLRAYGRVGGVPALEGLSRSGQGLGDVSLDDLLAVVRQVLAVRPPASPVDETLSPVTLTIAEQMALIERETAGGHPVSFRRLLERATSRLEVIVTLLALLELVKQLRVTMHQERLFGDILIMARSQSDREKNHVRCVTPAQAGSDGVATSHTGPAPAPPPTHHTPGPTGQGGGPAQRPGGTRPTGHRGGSESGPAARLQAVQPAPAAIARPARRTAAHAPHC